MAPKRNEEKRRQVTEFVRTFRHRNGYGPTVTQVAEATVMPMQMAYRYCRELKPGLISTERPVAKRPEPTPSPIAAKIRRSPLWDTLKDNAR